MKNTGIVLVGIAAGVIAAVVTYAVLTRVQGSEASSDEEFLAQVRGTEPGAGGEVTTASLGPGGDATLEPRIEVETEDYHMGLVASDKLSHGQVMVYNRGKGPLKISRVATQCGCTKGKMSTDVIPAGGEAPLEVTIDPYRISGFHSSKTLTLFTNDPTQPTVAIKVSAEVDPELVFEPETIDLGTVQQGSSAKGTLLIRQITDTPLEVSHPRLLGNTDYFDLTVEPVPEEKWKEEGHHEYLVTAKLSPNAPTGSLRTNAMFQTNLKRLPKTFFPVSAEVKGVFSIHPDIVSLRGVQPGSTVEGVLKLTSEQPVEVVGVDSENEFIDVLYHPGPEPNSLLFDLVMAEEPDQRWQRDNWVLRLKVNGKEYRQDVRVMAIVAGDPTVTVGAKTSG